MAAGDYDSMFANLPGSPKRPRPPPPRGLMREMAPVDPAEIIGSAVARAAGQPFPGLAPSLGLPNAELLGHDVTGWLQSPNVSPSGMGHAAMAAPVIAAAGVPRTAEEIAAGANAAKAAPAIIAYHGSPADFDKFSGDFNAEGEGSNAYLRGLYFAQNEDVARSYRDRLAKGFVDKQGAPLPSPVQSALEYVHPEYKASDDLEAGVQDAIRRLQDQAEFYRKTYGGGSNLYDSAVERLKAVDPNDLKPAGHMYQVGINADPEHFLDWDKSFAEQSPKVQDAISNAMFTHDVSGPLGRSADDWLQQENPTGEAIANRLQTGAVKGAEPRLQGAGIPGVKYLDQGSRDAGTGTSNYVVFDPATIEILKKYGLAGMLAPAGAGAAALSAMGQPGSGTTLNSQPASGQGFY